MTNTFLEDLKDLGYSQEEALTALKSIKDKGLEPSDPPPEPTPEPEPEPEEIDTPESEIKRLAREDLTEILSTIREESASVIKDEITKQLKVTRGSPPKGTEEDTASNRPIIQKNEYERLV